MEDTERLSYRAQEAADLLGIPYRTVMHLIHRGELGHRRAGRYYLVPRSEIERFLAAAVPESRALRAV
ncbi:helix-turn-helix domain-containing protein [Amycolatopsis palatopharyngis]|uniref:helix-turn-helix domain-containing protein n=1 Tax=Amycolatopsis palatopharyngis TaxID=187982 RepID=UPI000E21E31A|nr:helix-turn-helix domain-containing protein [Amycolatopsis palatopharyngis]